MIVRTEDVWCKLLTRGLTNEAGLRVGVARTEVDLKGRRWSA